MTNKRMNASEVRAWFASLEREQVPVSRAALKRVAPLRLVATDPWRDRSFLERNAVNGTVAFARLLGLQLFRRPVALAELPRDWEGGRRVSDWGALCRRARQLGLLDHPGYAFRWVITPLGRVVLDVLETA